MNRFAGEDEDTFETPGSDGGFRPLSAYGGIGAPFGGAVGNRLSGSQGGYGSGYGSQGGYEARPLSFDAGMQNAHGPSNVAYGSAPLGYGAYGGQAYGGPQSQEGAMGYGDWPEYMGVAGTVQGSSGEASPPEMSGSAEGMGESLVFVVSSTAEADRTAVGSAEQSNSQGSHRAPNARDSGESAYPDYAARPAAPPAAPEVVDERLDPRTLALQGLHGNVSQQSLGDEHDYSRRILRCVSSLPSSS